MSSTIIASNIPLEITEAKLQEFFSFCGKIKSISVIDKQDNSKSAKVEFENAAAVSTALLLNGAELGSNAIVVVEDGASKAVTGSSAIPTVDDMADVSQEDKPKSAIIAQYLSQGYVLSDQLVEKAVAFDKEHGYSTKFKDFLGNLDEKFHIQDKNNQIVSDANERFHLEENLNKGKSSLESYFDRFKQDKYGSRIHKFYTDIVKDTKDVHEEARRLAELKK
ncbi:hypothetical protein PACTADRAFT_30651, partial [Pachysolen tannophilus NRRL Y-2460]